MTSRRHLGYQIAVILLSVGLLLLLRDYWRANRVSSAARATVSAAPAPPPVAVENPNSKIEKPADAPSHLADGLNAPGGTVRRDLEILNEIFVAWLSNFPRDGNPVGENAEITAVLSGKNPLTFAFIPPGHPAINARGELCDRWGTPFRFHQRSGTQMEITSAGPDKKFGTADDAEFAPWPKP